MNALPIVVARDGAEQIPASLLARCPASLMDQLHLQGVEERLHRSVVIAATCSAHRWLGTDQRQVPAIRLGCILAPTIRMMNETRPWPLPLGGHHQSAKGQLGAHVIAH